MARSAEAERMRKLANQRSFKQNPPKPVDWNHVGAVAAIATFLLLSIVAVVGLVLSPMLAWMHPVLSVVAAVLLLLIIIAIGGWFGGMLMVIRDREIASIEASHRAAMPPPEQPQATTASGPTPQNTPQRGQLAITPGNESLLPGEVADNN